MNNKAYTTQSIDFIGNYLSTKFYTYDDSDAIC